MPIQQLNYQGINRAITDYGNAGACEELINLRPTSGGGLVPVKSFVTKMSGLAYDKVFVHKAGGSTNYISIKKNGTTLYIYKLSENGSTATSIDSFTVPSGLLVENVHFAYAGNYMLFSIKDDTNEFYQNKSYLWNGIGYEEVEAKIPNVSIGLSPSASDTEVLERKQKNTGTNTVTNGTTVDDMREQAESYFNEIQEENPGLCFGPFLVAVAFKTKDGKTFWTGDWSFYDPTLHIKAYPDSDIDGIGDNNTFINSSNTSGHEHYADFINTYTQGYLVYRRGNYYLTGVPVKLNISIPASSWDKDKSTIQSVEIYTSKPKLYLDTEKKDDVFEKWYVSEGDTGYYALYMLPQLPYDKMDLDNQFLYLQKSIPLDKLNDGEDYEFDLTFGGNIQATEKTLTVDAGMKTRYGKIVSYNARFHFFGSIAKAKVGMPQFLYDSEEDLVSKHVFVVYNDGQKDTQLYLGTASLPGAYSDDGMSIVIAPSIRIKQVITMYEEAVTGMSYNYVRYYSYYNMSESERYNYSIHIGEPDSADFADMTDAFSGTPNNIVLTQEPDAINVTEQYNPFVFNVKNSYLAPGQVLDIQPQMVAVRDVSFGDYPLNVFTNRGVYALLQGSGEVLYGAFRSVSNLISVANSIPTEQGTFFLAAGALWMVAGDHAVLISDALSLGPHKYIRNCDGFKKLSMGYQSINGAYNVSSYLSDIEFKDYVSYKDTNNLVWEATLSYNRFRDELYVSNPGKDYTYVLSLKYKQWYKITQKVSQDAPGSDIANTPGSSTGTLNILDLSKEVDGMILLHLQSRPFSFGYQYSHVHRLVAMVRTMLNEAVGDGLVVALYGSDDLQQWNLLTYAKRSTNVSRTCLSQVRTPPAARSWRYYTVCITGSLLPDADFGPIFVDYATVVRRFG